MAQHTTLHYSLATHRHGLGHSPEVPSPATAVHPGTTRARAHTDTPLPDRAPAVARLSVILGPRRSPVRSACPLHARYSPLTLPRGRRTPITWCQLSVSPASAVCCAGAATRRRSSRRHSRRTPSAAGFVHSRRTSPCATGAHAARPACKLLRTPPIRRRSSASAIPPARAARCVPPDAAEQHPCPLPASPPLPYAPSASAPHRSGFAARHSPQLPS